MKIWQKLLVGGVVLLLFWGTVFLPQQVYAAVKTCCRVDATGTLTCDDMFCDTANGETCDKVNDQCLDRNGNPVQIGAPTLTPAPTPTGPITTCCIVDPIGMTVCDDANCPAGQICDKANNKCVVSFITPTSSGVAPTNSPYDPCKNAAGTAKTACDNCKNIPKGGTWTAIGCLENDPPALVGHLIGIGGGIAGGIAFLLMLWGSAQLVLSQGVPEKIQAAKDTITSAVVGLVFIFLSVLILKLIGVQILGIPGWS
jgi:hypothetical protein